MQTVLVTGGSGFIAGWTIVALLQRGYRVRTTLRDPGREAWLRARIATQADPGGRLGIAIADLGADAGWDAAVAGCDHVLHVAAPVGVEAPRDPQRLIAPSRDGTLRVLSAACRAGVRRVVLTSAIEACRPPLSSPDGVFDETGWTDVSDRRLGPYRLAKTLAERAAWDFMARTAGPTSLTTILPAAVLGPVLGEGYPQAQRLSRRLLEGQMPGLPRIGFCVADVRDVADLHLRAMTAPQAAGQRYIAAGDWVWMAEIAALLRAHLGPQAARVPTRRLPDWLVRIAALRDRSVGFIVPLLGRQHVFSAAKARRDLGWVPRPAAETILDSVAAPGSG
ncbi:NAD-dependent epimerase/dehydratase family protein [Pseudoroseomonas cervicalis]|uniref:NAD-dependent epimerase/dehydratase family protein n=1 Tax=Teichococcus cervicalis TaxID=204525 RepID=UPI0027881596|nr:NAD-dependent epimerase/dehydratase family protein [Pseudoroseomonas cervicalis]MDQ1080263.1 dihydroflavonol-4-reductase [Pseudoroseomonas cervicalis]